VILRDGAVIPKEVAMLAGMQYHELCAGNQTPNLTEDYTQNPHVRPTPVSGFRFGMVSFPPGKLTPTGDNANDETAAQMDAATPGLRKFFATDGSGLHATSTYDFGIILKGELVLILDDEAVHLRQGDTFVMQGNRHAWMNPTDERAEVAYTQIGVVDPLPST
jgi:hypothetical protein